MGDAARRKALGDYPVKNDNTRMQRKAVKAAEQAKLERVARGMTPEEKARAAGLVITRSGKGRKR
jgi:hypothetical protein